MIHTCVTCMLYVVGCVFVLMCVLACVVVCVIVMLMIASVLYGCEISHLVQPTNIVVRESNDTVLFTSL